MSLEIIRPLLTGELSLMGLRDSTGLPTAQILEYLDELGAVLGDAGGWYIPENPDELDGYLAYERVRQSRLKERRVLRKLVDEENRRRDALQVLYDKTPPLQIDRRPGHTDAVAFFVLSDNHFGEMISRDMTYGLNEQTPAISKRRIIEVSQRALEKILKIRTVQTVNRLVLCLLGDHIHGDIHEPYTQIHGNAMTVLEETAAVSRVLLGVIHLFAPYFDQMDIVCVPGNHGRATAKKRDSQNKGYSYEQFMFESLNERSRGLNVQFHLSLERLQLIDVLGTRIRLMHGDDVRGSNPHTAIPKYLGRLDKIKAMAADLTVMGHWHQSFASREYIINGCTCGPNLYSLSCGFKPENPAQTLFLVTEQGLSSVEFVPASL